MMASTSDDSMISSWQANPPILVVMGVSGSGKSTIAAALARDLQWSFIEGDELHPPENIAKMSSGLPLSDDDRIPWLTHIAHWIDACRQSGVPGVITCSALKRSYREYLAKDRVGVIFIYLKISIDGAAHHLKCRHGHFMPPTLLPSQFGILEEPTAEEGVIVVAAERPVKLILDEIKADLRARDAVADQKR
jgi:carbohydrate kinase (thermoresistant glucokinase family)